MKPLAAIRFAAALLTFSLLVLAPLKASAQAVSFLYAQTLVPTGFTKVSSVGLDALGNIYFTYGTTIYKVPPGGGRPLQIASGLPFGKLAVDAAGNVFAAVESSPAYIVKIPAGGGPQTKFGTFTGITQLKLDPSGNIYVIDEASTYSLWKLPAGAGGSQIQVTLPPTAVPVNVASDPSGNIFVACGNTTGSTVGSFVEIPANGGPQISASTSENNINGSGGLAVDGSGNLFTAESFESNITELPAAGAPDTFGEPVLLGGGFFDGSADIALDSQNNIYVADLKGLVEIQRNAPVNFGNVNVCAAGQTQPAPCSETATLYYSVTASGTLVEWQVAPYPAFQPGSGTTCSGTVSAGSTCAIVVNFTPQTAGQVTGSVGVVGAGFNPLAETGIAGNGIAAETTSFITGQTPGPLRSNYTGFVGFAFTTGSSPLQISSLGRYIAPGNIFNHLLKLVQANGVDVPGGSVTVVGNLLMVGQYAYAPLANPITLPPNTTAYLVSQETFGIEQWYDYGPVTSTSAATVVGPVYSDAAGNLITVSDVEASYGPLNFLYTSVTSPSLSANITAPSAGALLSGSASIVVSTTGSVASLQLQVDGSNEGPSVSVASSQGPTYTLALNTTALFDGSHTLTVVASDSQSNTVTSSPVTIYVSNATASNPLFVTAETLGPLRNNYSGFVGFSMTTGSAPLSISYLGRYIAPGNSGTHLLKLVNSNGTDVPGGSATVSLAGAVPGDFSYAALASPISLQPNTTYFLVSQETTGGDQWYDLAPVTTTPAASITAPVYTDGGGNYVPVAGFPGYSYVPLSFSYRVSGLSATITSPSAGAVVSGASVPVAVTTVGTFTSLQLQVDGVNQGAAVAYSPLTLNTTTLTNGAHTLNVVITNGTSSGAVSAGVTVTVNNAGATATSLITGETPSSLRNNFSGFVGTAIEVGSTALSVTSLGRYAVSGNTGTHTLKLVQAGGIDVPGSTVTVNMTGATPGQFTYVTLPSPVALLANTTYYLVSQETAGGDQWYDFEPVTVTSAAQLAGPVYTDGHGNYVLVGGLPGYSYVPVSLLYQ